MVKIKYIFAPVAHLDRVLGFEPRGSRFKSCRVHHFPYTLMNLDSAVFYTNDINTIVAFYRDTLGFTVEYIQSDKYVSFIFPNGARLGIKKKIEEREIPGAQTVFIAVDSDIEKLYRSFQEKQLPIYKELTVQEWGKNFSILDPDANKIQFVEKPKTGLA